MAWQDEFSQVTLPDGRVLVAGSFRGVPFRTVDAEIKVGRRNQINEYPQRDEPYADDLGRRGRRYVIDAYLIGDNYLAERDDLIRAFETKGSGELIHPRYGILKVSLDGEVPFKETPDKRGFVRISATFVEDTSNTFPKADQDTVARVEETTNAADEATQTSFAEEFSVEGPSFLAGQAMDGLRGLTATVGGLLDTARQVTSVEGLAMIVGQAGLLSVNLAQLIRTPVVLVQSLRSLYAQMVQNVRRPLQAFAELQSVFFANERSPAVALAGSSRARSLANDTARADLQRRLSLTNQARMLAVAISDSSVVSTSNQAAELRDALVEQIDIELEANDPPVEIVRALSAMRTAVVRDVAARSEFLQSRSTFTPLTMLPAVVLAHRIYQDATRADELVERNSIQHPAFVPARPLEVLQ
jgi:prophage DNA circulation protein